MTRPKTTPPHIFESDTVLIIKKTTLLRVDQLERVSFKQDKADDNDGIFNHKNCETYYHQSPRRSSTIPTVIHIAFVGLHLDGDGFTNFDFAEVVVIPSIVERRGFPCFDVLIPSVTDTEKSGAKGSSRSCREVMKT